MNITPRIIDPIPTSLRQAFDAFDQKHWPADEHDPEAANRYWHAPCAAVLLESESTLIAKCLLHTQTVTHDGTTIVLGGLGGVIVHTDYRHQGLGTQVLHLGMQQLTARGCDVALLCTNTEKNFSFYQKLGFARLPVDYSYQGKDGQTYLEDEGLIAPLASPKLYTLLVTTTKTLVLPCGNW